MGGEGGWGYPHTCTHAHTHTHTCREIANGCRLGGIHVYHVKHACVCVCAYACTCMYALDTPHTPIPTPTPIHPPATPQRGGPSESVKIR